MRNALVLGDWIVTTDNSAAIGQKALDKVEASDELTAKFAARVALLEQWAAGSEPEAILLHNFSGSEQWPRYIAGIEEVFEEAGMACPRISGSSETNMETMQSALAVTMLGKRKRADNPDGLWWFLYGLPLVGQEVLLQSGRVAELKKIRQALEIGLAEKVWPVGSQGIAKEAQRMLGKTPANIPGTDLSASSGPATCIFVGLTETKIETARQHFGQHFKQLDFKSER